MRFTVSGNLIKKLSHRKTKLSLGAIIFHGYIQSKVGSDRGQDRPDKVAGHPDYVAVSAKMVIKELGWDKVRQSKYLKELRMAGLVDIKVAGFPGPKRYINPNVQPATTKGGK